MVGSEIWWPKNNDIVANAYPLCLETFDGSNTTHVLSCSCPGATEPLCGAGIIVPKGDQTNVGCLSVRDVLNPCLGRRLTLTVNATGWDVGKVTVRVEGNTVAAIYVASSSLSVLCGVLVVLCYLMCPRLQAWPGPLEINKSVNVFLLQLIFLVTSVRHLQGRSARDFCPPGASYFVQWSVIGVMGWYLAMTANAYSSLSSPFTSPRTWLRWYYVVVLTACFASATVLLASSADGYRANTGLCWTEEVQGADFRVWILMYVPILLVCAFGLLVMLYAWTKLHTEVLEMTYDLRKEILRKLALNVIMFTTYWIIAGVAFFAVFVEHDGREGPPERLIQNRSLSYFFAQVASSMGMWDALTWVLIHRAELELSWAERGVPPSQVRKRMRHEQGTNDISEPLRIEFIKHTTNGIKVHLGRRLRGESAPTSRKVSFSLSRDRGPVLAPNGAGGEATRAVEGYDSEASRMAGIPEFEECVTMTDRFCLRGSPAARKSSQQRNQRESHDSKSTKNSRDSKRTKHTRVQKWWRRRTELYPFVAYEWQRFAALRNVFGVSDKSFRRSLSGAVDLMNLNFSEGASGSFFFLTADKRYLVKTMLRCELDVLLRILPAYGRYMKSHRGSLICKFFGAFSVEIFDHIEYFTVMGNCLNLPPGYTLSLKFDLKGSTVSRTAKKKEGPKLGTLKDNDWLALNSPLELSASGRDALLKQLVDDSRFLSSENIMDYSILLGIHNDVYVPVRTRNTPDAKSRVLGADRKGASRGAAVDSSAWPEPRGLEVLYAERVRAPGAYHLGIIDILQAWDCNKWCERTSKILLKCHCGDYDEMSCVPPDSYHRRFTQFVHDSLCVAGQSGQTNGQERSCDDKKIEADQAVAGGPAVSEHVDARGERAGADTKIKTSIEAARTDLVEPDTNISSVQITIQSARNMS